ncbi:MAG: hypothetical protein Q9165_002187 [Trypethelium subeluteriae]
MDRSIASMPDKLSARGRTPTPTNSYLQERLAESREQSSRALNPTHATPQRGRDDYIFDDDEPPRLALVSSPHRSHRRQSSDHARGGLGVREMERHMDRLSKENFSLKLEVHHRDEALAKLRIKVQRMAEQVERVTTLETTNKELFEVNEELCKELEKRDGALKEAIEMINSLEDQNYQLQSQVSSFSRPPTSHADTGYYSAASNPSGPLSRSPSLESKPTVGSVTVLNKRSRSPVKRPSATAHPADTAGGHQPKHMPSSLSDKRVASTALRQLYLSGEESLRTIRNRTSMLSIMSSKIADNDSALPPSPPSPVLSEVSELDSTFFGQRMGDLARDRPPHEDPGTSLFTSSTSQAYAYEDRSLTSPKVGQSRSFEESSLHASTSTPMSPYLSQRLHHNRRSSAHDDFRSEHSHDPTHLSGLRSPEVHPQRRRHKRTNSDSVSPRSASPPAPSIRNRTNPPDPLSPSSYGGFPTGASISHGTPSRFARPAPAAANLLFDGEGIEDFRSPSSAHHHAGSSTLRKRSLSSGADTGPKASPPLIRNYTMNSIPSPPHGHPSTPVHTRRLPPYNRNPIQKSRHPLSQASDYLPYSPPPRDEVRPQTPSSQHPASASPMTSHSGSTPGGPSTHGGDVISMIHPALRHTPPQPAPRRTSFRSVNAASHDISPAAPGDIGGGGRSSGDPADRMSASTRSYEVGDDSAAAEQLQQETPPPRNDSRMRGMMGKGRSPSVDGSGGRKRWPWQRRRGEKGEEGEVGMPV